MVLACRRWSGLLLSMPARWVTKCALCLWLSWPRDFFASLAPELQVLLAPRLSLACWGPWRRLSSYLVCVELHPFSAANLVASAPCFPDA
jgi:hypothetical protein